MAHFPVRIGRECLTKDIQIVYQFTWDSVKAPLFHYEFCLSVGGLIYVAVLGQTTLFTPFDFAVSLCNNPHKQFCFVGLNS